LARLYVRKRGKSGSTRPISKKTPSWCKYQPEEVESIINEAAGEIERLLKENEDLARRVNSLQEQIKKYADLEDSIKKTLLTAESAVAEKQKSADQAMEVQIRETEVACHEMRQKALKEVETIKFELASLKMQKDE